MVRHRVCAIAWVVLGASTLLARPGRAAEVTRSVTAFDADDTFDLNVTATWTHEARRADVNNELETAAGASVVRDLKYAETRDVLNLRADFGILWDVGFHVQAPLVLDDSSTLNYDSGVNAGNSLFIADGILPNYNGTSSPVFQSPTRRGFESLGLGVNWAVFNQRRDDTKPTWTLGFDAFLDVFKDQRYDPANPNGNTAVGLGYHQLIWSTWISKRFRYFDPYFGAAYMLPIRTNGSIFQDEGGGQTGVNPQQIATVTIGVEQIAWENPRADQRVTIELRGFAQEHFAGRGYSELWQPLSGNPNCTLAGTTGQCRSSLDVGMDAQGNPTASPYPGVSSIDAYGSFGGDLGLNVQVGRYIRFRGLFGVTLDMPHLITDADAGVDTNGNGRVESNNPNEANPLFRESIDLPGRRFKVEESRNYRLLIEGSLMF
ncbi:MAG TPA: hypothetical protein VHG72_02840 [Polyangia bacterium]|nr:hypothetical protein [Polyangia bacterium]